MNDTADEIGTVGDCLYSIGNRVEVAKLLFNMGKTQLLETVLEDIVRTVQDMCDAHCVKSESNIQADRGSH